VSLIDILTPALLAPVLSSSPEILQAIFPTLPPDLPLPPSPEVLRRIIESTQFQASVRGLDRALRTGLLGGLVVGLGLPPEAGLGVEQFLKAIGEQAKQQKGEDGGDEMKTD
jgi:26S proteasome regulatory subunit N13